MSFPSLKVFNYHLETLPPGDYQDIVDELKVPDKQLGQNLDVL